MKKSQLRAFSGQKEIASLLGISVRTLQRHCKTLPASRMGGTTMILEDDLRKWFRKEAKNGVFKNKLATCCKITFLPQKKNQLTIRIDLKSNQLAKALLLLGAG